MTRGVQLVVSVLAGFVVYRVGMEFIEPMVAAVVGAAVAVIALPVKTPAGK